MATLEKALEIAARAHAGVKDKQGQPYILHAIRVMMGVDDEDAKIVAVLHDVVEDTAVTLEDIGAEGFDAEIIEALSLVTHQKECPYSKYVMGCKKNPIARQVKLSDLRDNTNLNRVLLRQAKFETDSSRLHKYILSYRFLTDQISEAEYLVLIERFE